MTTGAAVFTTTQNVEGRGIRWSTITITLCALLFFTMLDGFARFGRVPSLVWMAAYIVVFATFIQRPAYSLNIILRAWPVFLIPALALLSTFWTAAPMRTPLAATQLFMTVLIATHIARAFTTRQVMLALFLGQAAGLVISALNIGVGFMPAHSPINGTLIGIYGHKTALGYSAILSSFALTAWLAYDGKEVWGIGYAILVSPMVFLSQSSTAMAGYSALAMLCALLFLRRMPSLSARRFLFGFAMIVMVGTLVMAINFTTLSATFLNAIGKNTTLTGRTVLWDMAMTTWGENPFLGVGFGAFWQSDVYALDVSFVHAYVDDRVDGFHNAFLESAVALGALGIILLIAMVVIPLMRLMYAVFVYLSLDAMIWLSLLVTYIWVAMMFQDVGFKQHSGNYVLLTLSYLFAKSRA